MGQSKSSWGKCSKMEILKGLFYWLSALSLTCVLVYFLTSKIKRQTLNTRAASVTVKFLNSRNQTLSQRCSTSSTFSLSKNTNLHFSFWLSEVLKEFTRCSAAQYGRLWKWNKKRCRVRLIRGFWSTERPCGGITSISRRAAAKLSWIILKLHPGPAAFDQFFSHLRKRCFWNSVWKCAVQTWEKCAAISLSCTHGVTL